MTDEQIAITELTRLEMEGVAIKIELSAVTAFTVLANLQLATRHPGNVGEARQVAEHVGRFIQIALSRHSSELDRLAERGWHKEFDVPNVKGRG